MDLYPWAWLTLVVAGAVLEARALARKRGGATFSSQVWRVLNWGDEHFPYLISFGRIMLVGGGLWLGIHLAFGG